MNANDLRQRIREHRLKIGMTQAAAAEQYGCSVPVWNRCETRENHASLDVLIRMASAVGLDVDLKVRKAKSV